MPSFGAALTYGPHPSLAVIKNWKSIVELILRAVAAVLSLLCLIACAAAQDDTSNEKLDEKLLDRSNAAAGWGIFLCFIAMLTEAVIILMRFLNCGFITHFLTISIIVDMCVSGAFAVLLFITGIPLALFANQWDDEVNSVDDGSLKDKIERIPPALRAASAFTYIAMIGFIVLLVWILLHLILGWCKPSTQSHKTES